MERDSVCVVGKVDSCKGEGLTVGAWEDDVEGIYSLVESVVVPAEEGVNGVGVEGYLIVIFVVVGYLRDDIASGFAEQDNAVCGKVDAGFCELDANVGSAVFGSDGDATESKFLKRFLIYAASEGKWTRAADTVVVRIVTLGGSGVGEYHAAVGYEISERDKEIASDAVRESATLHMRGTDVDDVYVSFAG